LEKDLKGEESGSLDRIFRSLARGARPSGDGVDSILAVKEATQLHDVINI
jgi:hypothetical protein